MPRAIIAFAALAWSTVTLAQMPATGRQVYFAVGSYQPAPDPQLRQQDGHLGFALGISWRRSRHLALDLDLMDGGQEADMPEVRHDAPSMPGARMQAHINLDGIGGRIRYIVPLGTLEAYTGAGVGYYASEISSLGGPARLIVNFPPKRRDAGIGTQFVAGFTFPTSSGSTWGFEYRWLRLCADFGPELGGSTKIGGGMPTVTYRRTF